MGSTFYLFYMVLFTGGVLWCLFLWLVRDDEEDEEETGGEGPGLLHESSHARAPDGESPPAPSAKG